MSTLDALRRGDLSTARELRLADCGLNEVPREVFALADTLEVLDLSGNALSRLPDDLIRLTRLRVLFCSGNRFAALPPVLGSCQALTQIGFRGSGLREVSAEALPPKLRWLTLTDNALERMPDALGACSDLQKLMLAGNRLRRVPEGLADAANLQLLRLSANELDVLPPWLAHLPRLAWLAFAGNRLDHTAARPSAGTIDWSRLACGALLGEGASGHVHEARWRGSARGPDRMVALKLFKGAVTSDGLPACEMAACLAAGEHPHLTGGLGRLTGHPQQRQGLVMRLLPAHWRPLAGPPSLATCSRDVYDPTVHLAVETALRIARGVAAATAHLHARGLLHGDLYAHNILWDGGDGDAVLSDFGAASFLPPAEASLRRLDVLAWGVLLGELLDVCDAGAVVPPALVRLQKDCTAADPNARPGMAEVVAALAG